MAVLIPCHNEQESIAQVVSDFTAVLPDAEIYVYDNVSTDLTAARAVEAGAIVRREHRRGKGNVVRRMFADVDADLYVIVDGDGTYEARDAPALVGRLVDDGLDMVVGARQPLTDDPKVYRRGHSAGNAAFSHALRLVIGGDFTDILSGYRVLSKRFVKSFPVTSTGFEIETELSAHAVEIGAACSELPTLYRSRQDGTSSKLRTYRDGFRILLSMLRLFEAMRPLQFFGVCFLALTAFALILGIPVVSEWARTGFVPRFPTAILAASIQVVAFLCLTSGVILKSVKNARREARRLAYLSLPAPRR